ncbi:MAG TPA: hypothetical protein QGF35_05810 [Dehalococcoidia bacterium]|nr:hypothetical protein [Dehalococcoidia bacterium]
MRVGSRARLIQSERGAAEFEGGLSFTWRIRTAGITVQAGHSIEPIGNGSRAHLWVEWSGLGVFFFGWWLAKRASKRNLPLEATVLKHRAEG